MRPNNNSTALGPVQNSNSKLVERFFAHEDGTPLANAFTGKRRVHPSLGMEPVPQEEREQVWHAITARPRRGKSVAYLNVPFCEHHCLFCGFYQNAWRPQEGTRYVQAVIEHLKRDKDCSYQTEDPIHAVYFGGGTPTALEADDLVRLIEGVRAYLPLAPDCEITVEGRVHGFTADKTKAVFDAGANRVSLGVQSFDTALRRSLGRKKSREELIAFLETLLAMDKGAIIVDLLYGLPGQTLSTWDNDLRTAFEIGLDGVDVYSLKLITGTPLVRGIENGKFVPIAAAEHGNFYARAVELLDGARWKAISTTHWRRTTRERNLYNLLVKGGAQCLAFGAGAGGSLHGYSYMTSSKVEAFEGQIERGEIPVAHLMRQAPHSDLYNGVKAETELGRLNLKWLSAELNNRAGLDADLVLGPLFEQWQRAGLVVLSDDWVDFTVAGCYWQATITQCLLEWLEQNINQELEVYELIG